MTFSVDDLVASFNAGGHIGQEAIDIADLQAQLAQTLAYAQQQQQQQQYTSSTHGLCNTPTTARTPTTSFANWSVLEHQHRTRSRSASAAEGMGMGMGMETVNEDSAMDMDDELAVEQLLAPAQPSPIRCRGRGDAFYTQQNYVYAPAPTPASPSHTRYAHTGADPMSVSDCASPVSSSFAASDPFFAAAAAESACQSQSQSQSQQSQSSFFAQIGRPSQHSPFYAAAQSNAAAAPAQNQFGTARFVSTGTVDS